MPKQLRPRERLALHMDERRLDLDMRWADVATASGLTTETLRQVRSGDGEIRPLTKRAIETALRWERGSINAVLAGGEPQTVDTPAIPVPTSDDVEAAILADPTLTERDRRIMLELRRSMQAAAEAGRSPGTQGRSRRKASD